MWWKIYFWFMALMFFLGVFTILEYAPLPLIDLVGLVIEFTTLLGVFTFVYKRKMMNPRFWKSLFYIVITFLVLGLLEMFALPENFLENMFPFLKSKIPIEDGLALFALFLYAPAYYALYQLAFNKKIK